MGQQSEAILGPALQEDPGATLIQQGVQAHQLPSDTQHHPPSQLKLIRPQSTFQFHTFPTSTRPRISHRHAAQ